MRHGLFLVAAVVLCLQSGCGYSLFSRGAGSSKTELRPARTSITTEEKQPTVAHETRTIRHKDGRVETVMRTENTGPQQSATATAEGAGITASGEKIEQGFDATPPEIALTPGGGASSSGGGIRGESKAVTDLSKLVGRAAVNPLFWVGVVVLLGGIVCFAVPMPLKRPGMILVGSGIGLVAVSFLPAWGWWIIAVVFLGSGGFYLYSEMDARKKAALAERLRFAAAGVVKGVESLPDDVKAAVKRQVDLVTDEEDKAVIREVKRGVV